MQMFVERLITIATELPVKETTMLTNFGDESKVAVSVMSAGANLLLAWFVSRQMEGSLNKNYQKGLILAGTVGITVANALINHQVWT